ncbi:hypothetical protein F4825DRAFT_458335 [Nemania diffusa]|nr:hypothetical protein F4825DRAFT_458335 [Nemania diffusa]
MGFLVDLRLPQITYHRLRLSEDKAYVGKDEYDAGETPKRSSWHIITLYTIIIALAISLAAVSTLYVRSLRQHAPRPLLTCGNSIEAAKHAGCSFDLLTKTWLPAACPRPYEQEFARFPSTLNITEWKYWTDMTITKEITDEDMAVFAETKPRGEISWVSTLRMHLVHCAFGLMRRSALLDAGERIDFATIPLDHTRHCINLLLEAAMKAPGIDTSYSQGKVIFGAC